MHDLPNTRQTLIFRLKESSEGAWSEFVGIYEEAIVRFCRSRGLQEADARDVTQEVLSALFDRIESWKPDPRSGSFRAWLFRVARNIAVDQIRRRARAPQVVDDRLLSDVVQSNDQEEAAFVHEYRRSLFVWAAQQVKREVNDTTWRCFWMTAIEDRKPVDAATTLNVSVGAVYTAKCRVMARIRERTADFTDDSMACWEDPPVSTDSFPIELPHAPESRSTRKD